jgi:site-specific recombinase XerD
VSELTPAAPGAVRALGGGLTPDALAAFEDGTPGNTRRAYRDSLKRYTDWCAETGLGSLPATAKDLTEYATYCVKRGLAPVSIETARWAIVKWHALAGCPPPGTAGLVGVLKGYRARLAKTNDPKAKPKKAAPAERDTLAAMLAAVDPSSPIGRRDAAIILVGFGIGARRSEIAGLDIDSLDIRDMGMQVHVYRQKVRKMEDPVVKRRTFAALCPVAAAEAWVNVLAAQGRADGPLFVRIDRHGNLANPIIRGGREIGDPSGRMTGQAVGDVIRHRALAAGLGGRWSGHSLRRGLATEMHKAGAERRLIERQGGWSAGSAAVSGYIEDAERWLYDALDGVL